METKTITKKRNRMIGIRKPMSISFVDGYFGMLKNLTPKYKIKLIAMLSESIVNSEQEKSNSLKSLYGAFVSDTSANELVDDIKKARVFNRKRIEL